MEIEPFRPHLQNLNWQKVSHRIVIQELNSPGQCRLLIHHCVRNSCTPWQGQDIIAHRLKHPAQIIQFELLIMLQGTTTLSIQVKSCEHLAKVLCAKLSLTVNSVHHRHCLAPFWDDVAAVYDSLSGLHQQFELFEEHVELIGSSQSNHFVVEGKIVFDPHVSRPRVDTRCLHVIA